MSDQKGVAILKKGTSIYHLVKSDIPANFLSVLTNEIVTATFSKQNNG